MFNKSWLTFISLVVAFLSSSSTEFSQTPGECVVSGTVRDSRNAVVSAASVILSNDVGTRKVLTSALGEYCFAVAPGIYSVSVEAQSLGFDTTYRSEIKLDKDSKRILNLQLYGKLYVIESDAQDISEIRDHPPIQVLSISYEPILNLSEIGIRNGMIGFVKKCQSSHQTVYSGAILSNREFGRVRSFFTYDFFTVLANEFRINRKTNEIFATGNIEVENTHDFTRIGEKAKIRILNGKAVIERVL